MKRTRKAGEEEEPDLENVRLGRRRHAAVHHLVQELVDGDEMRLDERSFALVEVLCKIEQWRERLSELRGVGRRRGSAAGVHGARRR